MTRPNHARAHKSAAGTCRDRRRPQGQQREAWVRPLLRLHRALDTSVRLITSTLLASGACSRRAQRRPIQASKELHEVSERLVRASSRLKWAAIELEQMKACIVREPEKAGDAPELFVMATQRLMFMGEWLAESAGQVFTLHREMLEGLETGVLIPEPERPASPRIRLAPRPVPIRAFLRLRQPRVVDRIAPLLHRRRRTPRPAALRVPRRSVLGRAPPLFSLCLL